MNPFLTPLPIIESVSAVGATRRGRPHGGRGTASPLHQFGEYEKTPQKELEIARNRMKEVKDAKHS